MLNLKDYIRVKVKNFKYSSRYPSVSRDNGKTSLLGVETQRSYFSQGMCQDEKIEKWNQEEKAFY